MNNPYIVSETSATLIYEGKPYTITSSQPNFVPFKKALISGDFAEAVNYLDIKKTISNWSSGQLFVDNGKVFYGREELHGVIVDKLLDLIQNGLDSSAPFVRFLKNLLDNPSKSSVDELYDFLSYKALPIDIDGYVVGYKGVAKDFWSLSGNTHTTVLQGEVNERGQILNRIGDVIEVQRRCVDDNRQNHCSQGVHIGSFDYAKSWSGADGKLLMVRFNPKDAVSVPEDCDCQKLRVCKYEILEEIPVERDSELNKPFYGVYTDGNTEEEKDESDYDSDKNHGDEINSNSRIYSI